MKMNDSIKVMDYDGSIYYLEFNGISYRKKQKYWKVKFVRSKSEKNKKIVGFLYFMQIREIIKDIPG